MLMLRTLLLALLLHPSLSNTFLRATPLLPAGRFRTLSSRSILLPSHPTPASFEVFHTNAISPPCSPPPGTYDDNAVVILVFNPQTNLFHLIEEFHPSSLQDRIGTIAGCVELYSGKHGPPLPFSNTTTPPISYVDTAAMHEIAEESGIHLTESCKLYRLFPSPPSAQSLPLPSLPVTQHPEPTFMDKYSCCRLHPYLLITTSPPLAQLTNRDREEAGMRVRTLTRAEMLAKISNSQCSAVSGWAMHRGLQALLELGLSS